MGRESRDPCPSARKSWQDKNATLITTEKDFVRLPADFAKDVETLPVEISIKNPETLVSFIKDHLK